MITIFNRKELFSTFNMREQNDARVVLKANNIEYYVKTINVRNASAFSQNQKTQTGTLGENLNFNYEYIIYVKRKDYDKAKNLLRR